MSNNATSGQPAPGQRQFNVEDHPPILMLPKSRDEAVHFNSTQNLQEQFGEDYHITEAVCVEATSPAMWYLDPKSNMAWRIPSQPVTFVVSNAAKTKEIRYPPCKLPCCQNKPYELKPN